MQKKFIFLFWISYAISGTCFGLVDSTQADNKRDNSANVKTLANDNTNFAFVLYGRLKDDPKVTWPKGNLFFSPYSISTALGMTYSGARGETQRQMAKTLHFTLPEQNLYPAFGALQKGLIQTDKSGGYQLVVANSLWGQKGYPFLKEFLDISTNYFGGGLNLVDFANETEQSRQTINNWIEEKTNKKIRDLIPSGGIDPSTRLVVTNAIYFKGDWKTQFKKNETKEADFTISDKEKVKAAMMHVKEDFKFYEDEKMQVIELPYKGERISMLVILPRRIDGLSEIENKLTDEQLNALQQDMQPRKVYVYLPKFKMTCGAFSLQKILSAMGMSEPFEPEKADFSGMDGQRDLWISDVFHKAFIEVNEEGTEAAAATALAMKLTSVSVEPVFRADHPFIFIIRDNVSGSILFMGRLNNPVE